MLGSIFPAAITFSLALLLVRLIHNGQRDRFQGRSKKTDSVSGRAGGSGPDRHVGGRSHQVHTSKWFARVVACRYAAVTGHLGTSTNEWAALLLGRSAVVGISLEHRPVRIGFLLALCVRAGDVVHITYDDRRIGSTVCYVQGFE